ncbi:MAG: 5-formyltetrahydrofolate cyclo-ligase [Polaromonas sp.]|nr:5-formyltetrahydrofolate cyclo-ligase [Polaromonas sp.]
MPATLAIRLAKDNARALVLAKRNAMAAGLRDRHSREIVGRIVAMEEFQRARLVMAYCSFGSELATASFMTRVHQSGKTLVLPRINRQTNCLDLYAVGNLEEDLVEGMWGIREPEPRTCSPVSAQALDFVLVPGLAFDFGGGRLGYGRGYYDKLLKSCLDSGARPCIVAGAFDLQLSERVPKEAHDVLVHAVLTESQHIVC